MAQSKVDKLPTILDGSSHFPYDIELKPWNETNKIIPTGEIFEVIDRKTGLIFQVQRRAGSQHADVQPLTETDTAIMKAIYNGKWSWKRRAIYIKKGKHMIAASMHGMPHGAGALSNNFPGHFCIHLPGSTVHTTDKEDPTHQLMILKAAGKLDDYLNNATSEEMAEVFTHAVNQEDFTILRKTIIEDINKKKLDRLVLIDPVKVQQEHEPTSILKVEFPVKVHYMTGSGQERKKTNVTVYRDSITARWYIDINELFHKLGMNDKA